MTTTTNKIRKEATLFGVGKERQKMRDILGLIMLIFAIPVLIVLLIILQMKGIIKR